MSVISLKNITAAYGNKDVLMHFNLEIARGEFVMLTAPPAAARPLR